MTASAQIQPPQSDAKATVVAVVIAIGSWEPFFAWHPVRLYMTGKIAWMRPLFRRCIVKSGLSIHEYTDDPEAYPCPEATV